MKRKNIITLIVIILIILLAFFIWRNISIEKETDEYQEYTPQEEISEEQNRQTKVVLYFANIDTGELETETKIVDANSLINNPEKELFNLLIKGPQSDNLKKLIPDGTVIYDTEIERSTVIINVSNEFLNFENDENKLKVINSIVNTLTNLKEIDSVRFKINGEFNNNLMDVYVKSN